MQQNPGFCLITVAILTIMQSFAFAQTAAGINEEKYRLHIQKARGKIVLDGMLNEPDWQKAQVAKDFWQGFPYDTSYALSQTEARVTFDDNFLYIAFVCYQSNKYIVQSLKRDFAGGTSDVVIANIDPFRDKVNGFNFAVSPLGVEREALIYNGEQLSTEWDNKWYVKVMNDKDHWTVEMAIPFKTLRYKLKDGQNEWNINFTRNDLVRNERSNWAPVPRNFAGNNLAFSGTLVWDQPPPKPGTNLSVIPFVSGGWNKNYLNHQPFDHSESTGFDAKVAVTPSLNLDLTVNPDFAQVEVDKQVTNLSRFEIFFPEKRQFFLENSDLFGAFGLANVNPFFSRRIGLAKNAQTGETVRNPIIAGARLSGRLNNNWRIGILDMQTDKNIAIGLPSINYAVAAVQRKVFSRSNIGLIFVNREGFLADSSKGTAADSTRYNRVIGLDYNLASKDGRWNGKFFLHQSFSPHTPLENYATGTAISYQALRMHMTGTLEDVGAHYQAAVGFVPRTGYLRHTLNPNLVFYPKHRLARIVNSWSIGPDYDIRYGKIYHRITDWNAALLFNTKFQNSAQLQVALLKWNYTYLFADFDPTNTGGTKLPAGTSYLYFSNRLDFLSNKRNDFYYNIQSRFGQYYNGRFFNLTSSFSYRYQPFAIISMDVNYNHIQLPAPYSRANLWLIGPRFDLSMTKSIFFTTFVQYNNQINNVNVNARFQWRFKPVSDLYIVYTDNYFATADDALMTHAFQVKNRAIVLKLTYWFNI